MTAVITAERTEDYGAISRHGVEEFVADNVVLLRNVLEDEKRRRTIEILKFRGTDHQKGEFPFSVTDEGIVVIPLSAIQLKQKSSDDADHLRQRRARRDVRRRLLPRLDHPGLRRDRHRQDADGHRLHRRRASPRASAA